MATPTATSYSAESGQTISGGRFAPLAVQQLAADAIWTFHTKPEAVSHEGYTYLGWCDSTGWSGVSRINEVTGATDRMALINTGEVDDHNNCSIYIEGNEMVAFGNTHNTTTIRYRVLSDLAQFTNSGAWSADTQVSSGLSYAYMNPMYLTKDPSKRYLWSRRWNAVGGAKRSLGWNTTADMTAVPATYSARVNVATNLDLDNAWPYWDVRSNGYDRVDVIINQVPQNVGQSSVYHFYAKIDDSMVMRYYKTDGIEITASLPFNVEDECTLVYDGSTTRAWVSDVQMGADGHPRLLWPRMPGNNGAAFEYYYSRWTGSAWVNTKICDGGQGFSGFPWWYHRAHCFDANDTDRVYVCRTASSVDYVEEYRTTDNGATWSLHRTIRDSSVAGTRAFARPISPRNHTGALSVIWHEGTFTDFNDYDTNAYGAG
jgi:hypothetical protein